MIDGIVNIAQSAGILLLLILPSRQRCPDLVCPVATPAPVQPALERSLDFALTSAQQCQEQASSQSSYQFSLFWLGLGCGLVLALVVYLLVLCARTLLSGFRSNSLPERPLAVQTPRAPLAVGNHSASAAVFEPANPNTLRQLGLLR